MASAEPIFRIIMREQVCIEREMHAFYLGEYRERKPGVEGWRGTMPPLCHQGMPERVCKSGYALHCFFFPPELTGRFVELLHLNFLFMTNFSSLLII